MNTNPKGTWDDDDIPQPVEESKPDPDKLTDKSIMQWGEQHKGKMMKDVPGKYLLYYYENVKFINKRLKDYIEENMDSIRQEADLTKNKR